jgi:hypothetical protein
MAGIARKPDDAMREIEDRERRRIRPFISILTASGAHSLATAGRRINVRMAQVTKN